ncbi:hypothetical protein [aff. Roholtiella sp. LEGE 12411]|nr:hypothetical protein [aff. Roholtiella sp. LEGE 12411]MBE9039052.1 hypothetical protein [aff. Roholtiella sp. LEGE 12411]
MSDLKVRVGLILGIEEVINERPLLDTDFSPMLKVCACAACAGEKEEV